MGTYRYKCGLWPFHCPGFAALEQICSRGLLYLELQQAREELHALLGALCPLAGLRNKGAKINGMPGIGFECLRKRTPNFTRICVTALMARLYNLR